jgi:hypothetical protein
MYEGGWFDKIVVHRGGCLFVFRLRKRRSHDAGNAG